MWAKIAILAALQALLYANALARDPPSDLRMLFEGFQAHRRVAIGYLRTQNVDFGAAEIERLRERWTRDRRRLSAERARDAALSAALARTEKLVAESLKSADMGDIERSRQLLEEAAMPLNTWRKTKGIRLFADCIAEITAAYEPLDAYRQQTPDLADQTIIRRITAAANDTTAALGRCDREATEKMRREPEFRRLIDGMLHSLRRLPEAIGARDAAFLHRLLLEQRSFERLLAFRFG